MMHLLQLSRSLLALTVIALVLASASALQAAGFESKAEYAILYDYNTDNWTEINYVGDVRDDRSPSMAYDPISDRSYYYAKNEFWAFDYNQSVWSQLDRIPENRNRYFYSMAFDSISGQLIIFGGGPGGLTYDNAAWIYEINLASWRLVEEP